MSDLEKVFVDGKALGLTPRVSGGAVCRPLDPLVMRILEVVP